MANKLYVGIPVKNDLESFKEMINSLFQSTEAYDKIIIAVGKGTNKQTEEYLERLTRNQVVSYNAGYKYLDFEISKERFDTPLEAYNYLFKRAIDEKVDILMTQTDVIFPKLYKQDWLQQMKDIAQNEEVGAITCINGGGTSGPDYVENMQWLGGWCSYYPLRCLEKVGGYDINFPKPQFGVDVDHTYRIYRTGLKVTNMDYWVHHHKTNERLHDKDPESEIRKQECAKYFREKWKLNEFKELKEEPLKIFKNTKDENGIEIKDYISNLTKNLDESITECGFELTTDNGKTLNSPSPNKIKFRIKRKEE